MLAAIIIFSVIFISVMVCILVSNQQGDFDDEEQMKIISDIVESQRPMDYDDSSYISAYEGQSPTKFIYYFIKRAVDICGALVGLVLASPIFLGIVLAIKMDDGGKIFYAHTRVGQYGKRVHIYKFRSMKKDHRSIDKVLTKEQFEQYQTEFKITGDPRITRVGNFLRKSSLDELPQLLNILKGDLTIVGPRPIVEKETEVYGRDIAKFLSVKPGLTGYWQAYARNSVGYESGQRQQMEMYYIDHQSLWLDMKILVKTVFSVLKKEGAQ